ncbi:all trans-polyprenyl-diphosphate synthase PDSS2 [Lampetra fluviatilis]
MPLPPPLALLARPRFGVVALQALGARAHSGGGAPPGGGFVAGPPAAGPPGAWQSAVHAARREVGYPGSVLGLRALLGDGASHAAGRAGRLRRAGHPLLNTATGLVCDSSQMVQMRGLVVLLMSKAAGPKPSKQPDGKISSDPEVMVDGIYPSQRSLAEIAELIHTAFAVHRGIVDVAAMVLSDDCRDDMDFGNKMAVLSGDLLLANASTGLARLNNTHVVELMSSAIGDLVQGLFYEGSGSEEVPENASVCDYLDRTFLSHGALLAKSCQATLVLANQSAELQRSAFSYGRDMAAAHQLNLDMQPFIGVDNDAVHFSFHSAPAILHQERVGTRAWQSAVKKATDASGRIDFGKLASSPDVRQSVLATSQLCHLHGERALAALAALPPSPARDALTTMAHAASVL